MRRGSGRPETTRRRQPRASRLRRCAAPWWPRWTTGPPAPPIGTSRPGSSRWSGRPTRTPGATASVTPRRGTTRTRSANLAAQAPVAEQSPQLLAVLGARLRAKKLDAVPFPGARGVGLPRRLLGERRDGQCALPSVQRGGGDRVLPHGPGAAARDGFSPLRPRRPVSRSATLGRGHRRVRAGRPPGPRERLVPQPPGVHPGLEGRPRRRGDRPVPGSDSPRRQHRLVALLSCHRPRTQGPSRRGR